MALSNTVGDLIQKAYEIAGVIPVGSSPSSAQDAFALSLYNTMLKSWAGYGVNTFLRDTQSFSMTAAKATYTIGPSGADVTASRPIRINDIYRTDSNGYSTPLSKLSKNEYFNLSNKSEAGVPVQYYYDQETPSGKLYIWPIPATADLALTLTYDAAIQFDNATTTAATPDMADEWQDAAMRNLSLRLCVTYGRPIDPTAKELAGEALSLAKGTSYEDASFYIMPDYQGMR